MKKNFIKATLIATAITVVGLGSYKAYGSYKAANMPTNDLLAENILALSDDANNTRYPHLQGKPNKCKLSIVISANAGVSYKNVSDLKSAEGNVNFSYSQVKGMEDSCPVTSPTGCNPYTCQQIPY